jgi:hypothetical protein
VGKSWEVVGGGRWLEKVERRGCECGKLRLGVDAEDLLSHSFSLYSQMIHVRLESEVYGRLWTCRTSGA